MSKERADLGFGDEIESFDPSDWSPQPKQKSKPAAPKPKLEETKKLAEAAGFRSREAAQPEPPVPARQQRRRRTGRNAQFNIKAKPETIDAFCAIADAQDWGIGETLEKAVELLKREFGEH